ncbi:MAG: LD-carboxypeptidase [Candidatus Omnitrophica bacterium]|nr:LD-carboxypeptidase [Candidatus Omnitrophota bacterium]MBU1869005.1 LD-carboxypeptidase [Candidatus Omnitrophota bacterium]
MYKFKPTRPPRLLPGDTIGIVAPAWSFDADSFRKGVEQLKAMGFRVKYENTIFRTYWSMAGYDKERAAQINRMFADKEVKAIFCAKAGYGSIRTIPYLNKEVIRKNPKIFIGYSDITILLYYLYRIARMVVFHGPVVSGEMRPEMNSISRDYLLRAITQTIPMGQIQCASLKTLRSGRESGVLIGGNLSMVISAIGTPYDINTENMILFIEDIGEDLEVIDNCIMHLKLAGKFKKVKGIVFGRMVDCVDDSGHKYTIKDILQDSLKDIDVPIIYGFPSGHRKPGDINITLPFGVNVTLDADKPALFINEAAVK